MQLSLRQLRYVVAAADTGNVSGASRRLNVSQPSLSSAIAEVEAYVGVPLFVRHHGRGVTLTPAGEKIVNAARLLLKHAEDFAQSALDHSSGLKGEIVVGCFLTLAVRFMPALLARFAQRYPGIAVTLHEGDQEELLAMLLSGRAELALSYSFALPGEVLAEPLAELPPHAVVAAGHPLAKHGRASLRELAREPFLLLDLPHSRDYFFSLFQAVGAEPRVVFRSRSQELIQGLAAHGHGFGIQNAIPGSTIAYDGSRIAVLSLEEQLTPTRIMCLRLKRQAVRPAVGAFASYLSSAFAAGGLFAPGSITPPRIDKMQRRRA
jgi:DNA-binding transcriptional LysR family regulator